MQKVVFSVTKVNSEERQKGVGYLVEGNLLIPAKSSKGNTYIRVFENVTKHCKLKANSQNEYKGYVTVGFSDIPVFKSVDNDNNETKEGSYEILEYIEVTYYIWFKFVK